MLSVKFDYGSINKTIDVTEIIKGFIVDNKIELYHKNYNELFTDPSPYQKKFLKITIDNKKPIYASENASFSMDLSPSNELVPINIVYFINIYCQEKYIYILESQLRQLIHSGITEYANVYIEISGPEEKHDQIRSEIKSIITLPDDHINCHVENYYEYFGINKVWELSLNNDGVILYFHSKGITHITEPNQMNCRTYEELYMFETIIMNWKYVIWILSIFKSINKIGMGSSRYKWICHNYYFVRTEYARLCEKPIITSYRFYYEEWVSKYIGHIDKSELNVRKPQDSYYHDSDDCYNLCNKIDLNYYNIASQYIPF
jgi:hypothetical protein